MANAENANNINLNGLNAQLDLLFAKRKQANSPSLTINKHYYGITIKLNALAVNKLIDDFGLNFKRNKQFYTGKNDGDIAKALINAVNTYNEQHKEYPILVAENTVDD